MPDSDKRDAPRFEIQLPVTATIQEVVYSGVSTNISLGGMFVQLREEIPFGDMLALVGGHITVELAIPGRTEALQLKVIVRWTDTHSGIGVQFGGLNIRAENLLNALLEAHPDADA